MTKAAQEFVTPLAVGALAGERAFTDLFDRAERVRRRAHPAGARGRARRGGAGHRRPHGQDGARPCRRSRLAPCCSPPTRTMLIAPAMNPQMWAHRRRSAISRSSSPTASRWSGPNAGEMAESGEAGVGRMAEPLEIAAAVEALMRRGATSALAGRRVLVTSGPTHEPIDPVRYIANRSSGKQGHAIAAAAAAAGAEVTLVSGPGEHARSARRQRGQGRDRARHAGRGRGGAAGRRRGVRRRGRRLAHGDEQPRRRSRRAAAATPELALVENPDILATVAHRKASGRSS